MKHTQARYKKKKAVFLSPSSFMSIFMYMHMDHICIV